MRINKEAFKEVLARKITEGAFIGIILSLLSTNIYLETFFVGYVLIGLGLEVNNWKESN